MKEVIKNVLLGIVVSVVDFSIFLLLTSSDIFNVVVKIVIRISE